MCLPLTSSQLSKTQIDRTLLSLSCKDCLVGSGYESGKRGVGVGSLVTAEQQEPALVLARNLTGHTKDHRQCKLLFLLSHVNHVSKAPPVTCYKERIQKTYHNISPP